MVIFIHGPDTLSSREKLHEIVDSFRQRRDHSGLNVVRIAGPEFEIGKFKQECLTQGFLSPRKMVVVNNLMIEAEVPTREEVLDFIKKNLSKKEDSNVLVFWEGDVGADKKNKNCKLLEYLKKQEYVYDFPLLSGARLENWIIKRVEAARGKIRKEGAQKFCQLIGPDMWKLASEIERLVAYKNGEEICVEDIEEQVDGKFEANIFALTDAISSKNEKRALDLLNKELENGANELYLLTMIARQYRILLQIRDMLDQGQSSAAKIAKDLKLHPFVVQKSIPPAKRYEMSELKSIYSRLLDTDVKFKSSSLSPELLLDLLVVN